MARLFRQQATEQERRDELLSAYLDGQLSAEERARLEAQLATDRPLRAELEALRHTMALVRDLPPVPIPRNFILPQTVAARSRPVPPPRHRRAWAAPLLTAATAFASLLFVIVLVGDLLFLGVGGLSAPAAEPQMEAPRVAVEPSLVSEAVEVEEMVGEEVAAEEVAQPGVISTSTLLPMPTEAPPAAMPTATTAEAERYNTGTPEGIDATVPALGGGGEPVEEDTALAPPASPSTVEAAAVAPTALATATAIAEKDAGDAEPTPSAVAEVAPPAEEEEAEEAGDERGAPEGETALAQVTLWRVLEVTLGLTVLVLALATVWAWRARHR
jgi:hypothetical protein